MPKISDSLMLRGNITVGATEPVQKSAAKTYLKIISNYNYQVKKIKGTYHKYRGHRNSKQVGSPTKARAGFLKIGLPLNWEAAVGFAKLGIVIFLDLVSKGRLPRLG